VGETTIIEALFWSMQHLLEPHSHPVRKVLVLRKGEEIQEMRD
jgi:hypothetical protein